MYALVDCNNFYASCERAFNPALRNKPVVVLSNNDGCVIARSNEAKDLGITMGAPAFQFEKIFNGAHVNVFSSNYALYGDMSSRVMTILGEYTPNIEVYSIDEAFLNFDGFETHFDLAEYGHKIRKRILMGTGIPVSIGFAPTKALAKLANRIAKKFPDHCNNVYIMDTEEKREKALRWLPVEDTWGIGRRHAARLIAMGVKTAWDFTQLPEEYVLKQMTVVGKRLQRDLKGLRTIQPEEIRAKKNIACTRAFEGTTTDYKYLKERVATYAGTVAEKLRKENTNASLVTVFLNTNPFAADEQFYNPVISYPLPFASNSTMDIVAIAHKALEAAFKPGYKYKKAGVY